MNQSSYITIKADIVVNLAEAKIERIKDNGEYNKEQALQSVEAVMRRRRWWKLVGPWLVTSGAPSDKVILLWAEQSLYGYSDWNTRKAWDSEIERGVERAQEYINAAKDGDPFLLTLSDYKWLSSKGANW